MRIILQLSTIFLVSISSCNFSGTMDEDRTNDDTFVEVSGENIAPDSFMLDYGAWKIEGIKRIYYQNEEAEIVARFTPEHVYDSVRFFLGQRDPLEVTQVIEGSEKELFLIDGQIKIPLATEISPSTQLYEVAAYCIGPDGELDTSYISRFTHHVEHIDSVYDFIRIEDDHVHNDTK